MKFSVEKVQEAATLDLLRYEYQNGEGLYYHPIGKVYTVNVNSFSAFKYDSIYVQNFVTPKISVRDFRANLEKLPSPQKRSTSHRRIREFRKSNNKK